MKLLTKSNAPDAKLGILERTGYMMGNVGTALMNTIVASYVMFYYTDVMYLNAAVIGAILLLSRLFDGVTDIIMGIIVDHTHSKFGKGMADGLHCVCCHWDASASAVFFHHEGALYSG